MESHQHPEKPATEADSAGLRRRSKGSPGDGDGHKSKGGSKSSARIHPSLAADASTKADPTQLPAVSHPPLAREFSQGTRGDALDTFKQLSTAAGGNMFVNATWHLTPAAKAVCVLVGLTLFPIRVILTILNVLLMCAVAGIGTCGLNPQSDDPLPTWRRVVTAPLRPLMRFQLFLWGYHWITVHGRPADKEHAPIIVANHMSFVEPVFLMAYAGGTPVAAIENASLPLIGGIFKAVQTMFVQRIKAKPENGAAEKNDKKDTSSAAAVKEKIVSRAKDMRFPQVLLFPEGTCANGTAVISFKTGAFNPGLPVQPVAIRYPHQHFDPSWVSGGPALYSLMLRMMCQLYNRMEVTFLPPYCPTPSETEDPRLFAANVQRLIARTLKVRVSNHAYEDVILTSIAAKAHYPIERAAVEFQALRNVLDIDGTLAVKYLQRFIKADPQRSGKLSYEQFRCLLIEASKPGSSEENPGDARITRKGSKTPSSPGKAGSDGGSTLAEDLIAGQAGKAAECPAEESVVDSVDRAVNRAFTVGSLDTDANSAPQRDASGRIVGAQDELFRLFTLLDIDEDGALDFRELLVGLAIINEHGNKHREDTFKLAFRMLDTEGNGRVSKNQLERALRKVWPDLTSEAMDQIFQEADANRDGTISASEFTSWAMAHEEHLPLFRQIFFGFKDEPEFLAPAVLGTTRKENKS